jgi:hypothetical protein
MVLFGGLWEIPRFARPSTRSFHKPQFLTVYHHTVIASFPAKQGRVNISAHWHTSTPDVPYYVRPRAVQTHAPLPPPNTSNCQLCRPFVNEKAASCRAEQKRLSLRIMETTSVSSWETFVGVESWPAPAALPHTPSRPPTNFSETSIFFRAKQVQNCPSLEHATTSPSLPTPPSFPQADVLCTGE